MQQLEEHGKNVYGPRFMIDDRDRPAILKLLAYFLHDETVAAAEGPDLQKGILLMGPTGCGKTSLMTIIRTLASEPCPCIVSTTWAWLLTIVATTAI